MPCYIHLYSLHLSLGYSTKAYPEMRELDRFQNHHISIKYTQILEDWSLSEVLNIFPDQSVSPFSSSLLYCIILLYPLISRISKSSKYPTWCSTLSHDFTGKVKELSRSRRPLVSAKVDWKITSTCRGFLRCRCKPSGSEMMSSKETWLNQQRWWSNQEKKALFNQQRFRCNWRKTEMQPTKKNQLQNIALTKHPIIQPSKMKTSPTIQLRLTWLERTIAQWGLYLEDKCG